METVMPMETRAVQAAIGVDFDNTIASYDETLFRLAREFGFVGDDTPPHKRAVRDAVRRLEHGAEHWQRLQAHIYGPGMAEARMFPGVWEFFLECRRKQVPVYIVSHKTRLAPLGNTEVDLRAAALAWMRTNRFFQSDGLGLRPEQVFFEPSRAEKLARIAQLSLAHFIDDLEETFCEEAFPEGVERLLFAPHGTESSGPWQVFTTWQAIHEHLLGSTHAV